jgi:hypothetical protein
LGFGKKGNISKGTFDEDWWTDRGRKSFQKDNRQIGSASDRQLHLKPYETIYLHIRLWFETQNKNAKHLVYNLLEFDKNCARN